MGIEPTTSGLDLLSLCRLSYEIWDDLGGEVRVHMNVVPRSTMNTNVGTENYL